MPPSDLHATDLFPDAGLSDPLAALELDRETLTLHTDRQHQPVLVVRSSEGAKTWPLGTRDGCRVSEGFVLGGVDEAGPVSISGEPSSASRVRVSIAAEAWIALVPASWAAADVELTDPAGVARHEIWRLPVTTPPFRARALAALWRAATFWRRPRPTRRYTRNR